VVNIKNISLHEYICASMYRKVDNKLPSDTASYQISKDTKCSWSHPGWNWWSWGMHEAEETEVKYFERILQN